MVGLPPNDAFSTMALPTSILMTGCTSSIGSGSYVGNFLTSLIRRRCRL
jgi:hypothetical protein